MSQTQLASLRLGAPYIPKRESTAESNRPNSVIHITNGRTDEIIGFFTQKDTTFNEHTQNLETYQDSFEFSTFGNHKYAHTLTDMNRVIIPAEDGVYSEYVIDTARKSRSRSNLVRVKTFASYQMLSVAKVIRPTSLSAYTPSQVLGFIANDTEWRPGITESNATRTFHIENHTDRFSFLKSVANEFELEIRFRVETDGKRVTGRFIDLLERVGDWRGREITFGKDLDSIERTEEFGNIYTKLICLGPEDEEGNRLVVEVSDDDALRRWGRPHPITGELMHLEDVYEPTSDRTDMTESELRQYGRTELNKRINSIVTYEAEVVDLENVPGMANKKIRFGDTVRIKDEKFNPPLYVEARIFEQRRDIFTKSNKKVKLGDFIEYTEEELRAVIDRLSKQMQTKIGVAQLIEHTYSKVEIDQKDQYVFDEGKSFAEAVGITTEDNAKQFAVEQDSALKIDVEGYADQVADQAEDNAKVYADDVSAQALQQALAESVAKDTYNAKMAEIASDLSEKAGITYVDGKLQIVDGAIADLNAEIDTKADGSTVYTISEVDNMINNTVSKTQYTTDINGIVTDLTSHNTRLGQNEEAIGLQADRIDMVEGTVSDHSAELLTMADEISARVTADYVQTAIDDVEIGGRNLAQGTSDSWETKTHYGSHFHVASQYSFDALGLSPGDIFTLSIIAESMSDKYALRFRPEFFEDNANRSNPIGIGDPFFQETRCVATLIVPSDKSMLRILFNGEPNNDGVSFNYRFKSIKIEKGNKATDWSPAPEDIDAEISSLSAELSVQAGIISAKADSSTVNALGTRISTAESNIDAIEGEISSKVSTTQFNTLSGTVSNLSTTVSQQATQISSKVTSAEVESIFTQKAGSFTFQANQINFDGHVFGENATFSGTIDITREGGEISIYENIYGSRDGYSFMLQNDTLYLTNHHSSFTMDISSDRIIMGSTIYDTVYLNNYEGKLHVQGDGISVKRAGKSFEISLGMNNTVFTSPEPIRVSNDLYVDGESLVGNISLTGNTIRNQSDAMYIANGTGYAEIGGGNAVARIGTTNWRGLGTSSGLMYFGRDGTGERIWAPSIYDRTYSSSANLYITEAGTFGRATSARKYKTDIEPLQEKYAYNFFDNVQPVFYRSKNTADENKEYSYYGYIADDVAPIEPRLVQFKDGEPESFNYDRVPALLHVVLKNEIQRIDALETEKQLLKNELKIIKERIT